VRVGGVARASRGFVDRFCTQTGKRGSRVQDLLFCPSASASKWPAAQRPAQVQDRYSAGLAKFIDVPHDEDRLLIFAPAKFFLFCREAKFGEFRLTAPAQVVCWLQVRE
jgi:hypothetical protein